MEELLKENQELKERIKYLEKILKRRSSLRTNPYDNVQELIKNRVNNEVMVPEELENWQKRDIQGKLRRQLVKDMKWDLRIKLVTDFTKEDISRAEEYINQYVFSEELLKEVASDISQYKLLNVEKEREN